jgi:hypothetical protein
VGNLQKTCSGSHSYGPSSGVGGICNVCKHEPKVHVTLLEYDSSRGKHLCAGEHCRLCAGTIPGGEKCPECLHENDHTAYAHPHSLCYEKGCWCALSTYVISRKHRAIGLAEGREEARWLAEVFVDTGHATNDIIGWLDRAETSCQSLRKSLRNTERLLFWLEGFMRVEDVSDEMQCGDDDDSVAHVVRIDGTLLEQTMGAVEGYATVHDSLVAAERSARSRTDALKEQEKRGK